MLGKIIPNGGKKKGVLNKYYTLSLVFAFCLPLSILAIFVSLSIVLSPNIDNVKILIFTSRYIVYVSAIVPPKLPLSFKSMMISLRCFIGECQVLPCMSLGCSCDVFCGFSFDDSRILYCVLQISFHNGYPISKFLFHPQ